MYLYSLRIEGFRKHWDTTILLSDSTFLIGENNAGKSSVLQALDYLLSAGTKIPENEFYATLSEDGSPVRKAENVVLTAEFRDLPEEAKTWRGFRGRLIPYEADNSDESGLSIIYRKTFFPNGAVKIEIQEYKKVIKEEFTGCNTIAEYLANGLDANELPDSLKTFPHEEKLKAKEKKEMDQVESIYQYDEEERDWFQNPGGIQQNVLSKLPTILLIPAQDREEEISGGNGTLQKTLGELFKEIRDESDNYKKAQEYLDKLQEELNPNNKNSEISKMICDLNEIVDHIFPNASISATTNLSDPDSTIKPTFQIQMASNISTPASLQGTGMVRSAVFALLRYKSNRDAKRNNELSRPLIICFEEPELYLHPNAINNIRDTIYSLAATPHNQIVCTTHSPYMIDISRKPRQILNALSLGQMNTEGWTGEFVISRPFSITKEFLKLQDDDRDYVKMLLKVDETIAKSFFAKKVLIVEGDTEQLVISETISYLPGELQKTIKSDWHIIRARGKAAIIPVIKYLKAMGIDIFVIHDGDFGTENAERFNEPIRVALGNDTHLVVLDKCIEDALGYKVPSYDKPLHAYQYIKNNWNAWKDIEAAWRKCIEKIFNSGNEIVITDGLEQP